MNGVEWTVMYLTHLEDLSDLRPFVAPCSHLTRHVHHQRTEPTTTVSGRIKSWSDPELRAARLAKRQATIQAKYANQRHPWGTWNPKETEPKKEQDPAEEDDSLGF